MLHKCSILSPYSSPNLYCLHKNTCLKNEPSLREKKSRNKSKSRFSTLFKIKTNKHGIARDDGTQFFVHGSVAGRVLHECGRNDVNGFVAPTLAFVPIDDLPVCNVSRVFRLAFGYAKPSGNPTSQVSMRNLPKINVAQTKCWSSPKIGTRKSTWIWMSNLSLPISSQTSKSIIHQITRCHNFSQTEKEMQSAIWREIFEVLNSQWEFLTFFSIGWQMSHHHQVLFRQLFLTG